jgi:hypothetical protein
MSHTRIRQRLGPPRWFDSSRIVRVNSVDQVNFDCLDVSKVVRNGEKSLGLGFTIYEECSCLYQNFVIVYFFSLS